MKKSENGKRQREEDNLTAKQRAFVAHYLANNFNATKAARLAGYSPSGSASSAANQGSVLLRNMYVRNAIDAACRRNQLSADEVLSRLREMATSDVSEFCGPDGKIKPGAYKKKGYLVKRVKSGKSGTELELYDAQAALIKVGQVHGLFNDKIELTGAGGGPVEFSVDVSNDDLAKI